MGGIEGVLNEKSDLLRGLPSDGTAVIPQGCRFRNELAAASQVRTVDLTGGAPEMNPHFRRLVEGMAASPGGLDGSRVGDSMPSSCRLSTQGNGSGDGR